ncbi:MAG: hypothetical protein CL454_00705 [Acidimicrobiaceae bacterium]|nr:hypothetical protein [Acidimicrobiaceae bacterium]|tara:strand:+ start:296 stop:517 length:222 start_codon:yes stop_codon:yes gene_type:complete
MATAQSHRQLKTSLAELDKSLATLARHARALDLARKQVEAKRDALLLRRARRCKTTPVPAEAPPLVSTAEVVL